LTDSKDAKEDGIGRAKCGFSLASLAALARKYSMRERRPRAKGAKDAKEDGKGMGKAAAPLAEALEEWC
jgi:hypothetical protein